ncbi:MULTISPECIES: AI-2E family transporter [Haloferax]|uniref:AI-2E family transporter n=2 Tax=Haloferax TaxID=2251 RepID=A0A6G1Z0Q0_9EURY|nr:MULTISPECIES: AI-2E family transporter [Haloferax]KAB1187223.1 AI-2E family transporter [Haloferax sp. CBA1149]MRW79864.1 AI-2E family transporter [Haloferax marinisediminis]
MTTVVPQARRWWWGFGLVLGVVVLYVGWPFIGTLSFALFLYYFARPISTWAERYVRRSVATAITIVLVLLPFVVVLLVFALTVLRQLSRLTGEDVAFLTQFIEPYIDLAAVPLTPQDVVESLSNGDFSATVTGYWSLASDVFSLTATVFIHLTVVLVVVSLLLKYDQSIAAWVRSNVADPDSTRYVFVTAVDRELQHVYFGQMLTIFVVMLLSWLLYSVLNLVSPAGVSIPFPLLLGLVTGVATFIPVIGRALVYVPLSVYLAVQALLVNPVSLWFSVAVLAAGLFGLDPVVRYVVRPNLTGRMFGAGVMLLAYLMGAVVFGWYGVFLAPFLLVVVLTFVTTVFPSLIGRDPTLSPRVEVTDPGPEPEPGPDPSER